jgi:Fe2+ transport system protein B
MGRAVLLLIVSTSASGKATVGVPNPKPPRRRLMLLSLIPFVIVGAALTLYSALLKAVFSRQGWRVGYCEGWDDCADTVMFPTTNVNLQHRDAA